MSSCHWPSGWGQEEAVQGIGASGVISGRRDGSTSRENSEAVRVPREEARTLCNTRACSSPSLRPWEWWWW
jgi:hypothetical protein